jgi:hypothetical protein
LLAPWERWGGVAYCYKIGVIEERSAVKPSASQDYGGEKRNGRAPQIEKQNALADEEKRGRVDPARP